MIVATATEALQLGIGTVLGFVLSLNLDRHGLKLRDPKTRWTALAILVLYAATYVLLTHIVVNSL